MLLVTQDGQKGTRPPDSPTRMRSVYTERYSCSSRSPRKLNVGSMLGPTHCNSRSQQNWEQSQMSTLHPGISHEYICLERACAYWSCTV